MRKPSPMFMWIKIFAILDAFFAPAMSPCASLELTWKEKMIATMPPNKQQNSVVRTDGNIYRNRLAHRRCLVRGDSFAAGGTGHRSVIDRGSTVRAQLTLSFYCFVEEK